MIVTGNGCGNSRIVVVVAMVAIGAMAVTLAIRSRGVGDAVISVGGDIHLYIHVVRYLSQEFPDLWNL